MNEKEIDSRIWAWKLRKSKVNESHHKNIDLFFPIFCFVPQAMHTNHDLSRVIWRRLLHGWLMFYVSLENMYISTSVNYVQLLSQFPSIRMELFAFVNVCVCVSACLSNYICAMVLLSLLILVLSLFAILKLMKYTKSRRYFLEHLCGYTSIQCSIWNLNHTWHCLTLLKM